MRVVLALILLFSSFFLQASEINFTYFYIHKESKFNLELYELSKVFEGKKFQRLTSSPEGNIPIIHADEVMTSPDHRGSIFIKMNLIAPKNLHYKIIAGEGFYLYHTQNASIAFFDFSKSEVIELVKDLNPSFFSGIRIKDFFMSEAVANDIPCGQLAKLNAFPAIEAIKLNLDRNLILKKLGECGVTALRAMNTKAESTKDFFQRLSENPMILWKEIKENFSKMYQVVTNITNELQGFYEAVRGLGTEEMLEIGCAMIGEAIPGIVMTATGIGAGFGVAKLTASLLPKIKKLKDLLTGFRGNKFLTTKEAISCAF